MSLKKAMIFAAGRGERMRPLTDTCPKPLLPVGGKPLIVWQIERLAHAGFQTIVINHAWLGERIEAALGDGSRWGVQLRYSAEHEALEALTGPGMHLVMVPNPAFHPNGDFGLVDGTLSLDARPRFTFGNIGLYDTRMFRDLPRGTRRALTPYYRETIASGLASGELYEGLWENVGTPAQLQALDQRLRAR